MCAGNRTCEKIIYFPILALQWRKQVQGFDLLHAFASFYFNNADDQRKQISLWRIIGFSKL